LELTLNNLLTDSLKMKIKNYIDFTNQNILYVFDFDDTLVNTPSFEELAIQFLKEDISIKDLLINSVNKIGVSLNDLKWQDERIYVEDPSQKLNVYGNWVRKGARVYLTSPDIFCRLDLSLPSGIKELSELYNSIENKCIVTARQESIRDKVISTMNKFGLEMPKYGLHMLPDGTKNAGAWKGEKIVDLSIKLQFNRVKFYDDNPKYIKKALRVIREKLPQLDIETIRVK